MAYQVLYRTYRPQKFSEVVGQEYVMKTLKNAIKMNKIAHAYLFAGPRGTGKTTIAKLFAKAVNCPIFDDECCDTCDSCKAFLEGNHPDIIEMDAASNNGVDEIRSIVEEVSYAPILARYKVYIIDEAHMLTANAFNALLKTLEEPPEHVIFILATTDPQKIIPTVLSRCQRYNFSKISNVDMKKKMIEILKKEDITYEDEALDEVCTLAEGGMRDALSILEQILSYNTNGVFLEDVQRIFGLSSIEQKVNLLINIHNQNISEVINDLRDMYQSGIDSKRLAVDLLEIIKETLIYSENGSDKLLTKIKAVEAQDILNHTGVAVLLHDINCLEETILKARVTQNFLSYLELSFIKMAGSENTKQEVVYKEVKPKVSEKKVEVKKEEIKPEPKEETIEEEIVNKIAEPELEEPKEEFKEAAIEKQIDVIDEIKEDKQIDLEYIARLLAFATKESKINDAVIYNRLELYKFEPDNRKFYELLHDTELFASSADAIIIVAEKLKASNINSTSINEEIFNFINKEFGINKMVFAVDKDDLKELITKFKALTPEQKQKKPEVVKYEIKKVRTTEDKLKELFDDVTVE